MKTWREVIRQPATLFAEICFEQLRNAHAVYKRNEIERRVRILDWTNPSATKSSVNTSRSESERLTWASFTIFLTAMPTLIVILH